MERSVPAMMIEKCAQMLENTIIPALTDETLVLQVRHAAVILHTFAPLLEGKSKEHLEENRAMQEVLGNARDLIGRCVSTSNKVWAQLKKAIDPELEGREIVDVLEENQRLKAVLANTIKALDMLTEQMPPETVASLKGEIHRVVRQQINHALGHLPGLQMKM